MGGSSNKYTTLVSQLPAWPQDVKSIVVSRSPNAFFVVPIQILPCCDFKLRMFLEGIIWQYTGEIFSSHPRNTGNIKLVKKIYFWGGTHLQIACFLNRFGGSTDCFPCQNYEHRFFWGNVWYYTLEIFSPHARNTDNSRWVGKQSFLGAILFWNETV